MVVAVIALVVAASGTAVAASNEVSGDSLIKKNSLSGNRLRDHTLTGLQIKLSGLGTSRPPRTRTSSEASRRAPTWEAEAEAAARARSAPTGS